MTPDNERIAKATSELRHRAANTLQLIGALARMRGQKSGDAETRRQLIWVSDSVATLGALERHRTSDGIAFDEYLREIGPTWRLRHGPQAPALSVEAAPMRAPDTAATSLALIGQELVANAMIHAYPGVEQGQVVLSLSPSTPGRYALSVSDQGVGIPEGRRDRFGLWFVRSLAAQVRGEFTLDGQDGVAAQLAFAADRP